LDRQVAPIAERLRAILGTGEHSWKEIEGRIRIFKPERREAKSAHFGLVAAGLLRRLKLWVRHHNRKENRDTERQISPQRLVHYRDNWYVDAWCHLRNDLRS